MSAALAYARASDTRPNDSLENSTTKTQIEINPGEASACGGADSNGGGPASDFDRFDHLSATVLLVHRPDYRRDGRRALRILGPRPPAADSCGSRCRTPERGCALYGLPFYRAAQLTGPPDDSAHLDPADYRIAGRRYVAGRAIRPDDHCGRRDSARRHVHRTAWRAYARFASGLRSATLETSAFVFLSGDHGRRRRGLLWRQSFWET